MFRFFQLSFPRTSLSILFFGSTVPQCTGSLRRRVQQREKEAQRRRESMRAMCARSFMAVGKASRSPNFVRHFSFFFSLLFLFFLAMPISAQSFLPLPPHALFTFTHFPLRGSTTVWGICVLHFYSRSLPLPLA